MTVPTEEGPIDAMLSSARERLRAARINQDQGLFNDSTSRSYYAAFHSVNAVLFSQDLIYSSHSQVVGGFNKNFVKTRIFSIESGKALTRLFNLRQKADYDIYTRYSSEESEEALRLAELVLKEVEIFISRTKSRP
jgi:uncharacterized protein (UPF0332 family)